jgi:BirA family biotin operon repressor/biotin-[acetyl-CoA-carboxylase] ligase
MAFSGTVIRLDSCDSTNAEIIRRASRGAQAWTVVVSDEQTAGRGRLDREWYSPGGEQNLYLSVLLRPSVPMERVSAYSIVTALALAESVAGAVEGDRVKVKWPNDLLVDGKKVAGVLTELQVAPGGAQWVILGVGVNVNLPQTDFPEGLSRATSLYEATGEPWDRDALLEAFLDQLTLRVDTFARSGGVLNVEEWSKWANLGETVRFGEPGDMKVGVVLGLTSTGALRVKDQGGVEHELIAGDVLPLTWED